MDTPQCVGGRIRAIRKSRGLTQEDLAARIGRSVSTLSELERGIGKPSFDTLLLLASALDVPARDFFAPTASTADSPDRAVLYGELVDAARTLPPDLLNLTVRIVAVVARWHESGRSRAGTAG